MHILTAAARVRLRGAKRRPEPSRPAVCRSPCRSAHSDPAAGARAASRGSRLRVDGSEKISSVRKGLMDVNREQLTSVASLELPSRVNNLKNDELALGGTG